MTKSTITLNGRDYELVGSRVERYRKEHPDHSFTTELKLSEQSILAKATISDGEKVLATGHAEVIRGKQVNPVEKAETKAIGRALAFLGYAGQEFTSAEEMLEVQNSRGNYDR